MTYKSDADLQAAFAGESQANRRYLFFADKAEKEGYPQIARLFRAVAEAETVHAQNHFNAMDAVGSTKDNLLAGINGEHYEFTRMYPLMIAHAEDEQNDRARTSFIWANEVEQIHHKLYQDALKTVQGGQALKNEVYFVCQRSGNKVAGAASDTCPICGSPKSMFKKVE